MPSGKKGDVKRKKKRQLRVYRFSIHLQDDGETFVWTEI